MALLAQDSVDNYKIENGYVGQNDRSHEYPMHIRDCVEALFGQDVVNTCSSLKARRHMIYESLISMPATRTLDERVLEHIHSILFHELMCSHITTLQELRELPTVTKLHVGHHTMRVWKGDITTLKVNAIVNAANDSLLGCFNPRHKCIDNQIHAKAGPLLRTQCANIKVTKHILPGQPMVTDGFALPCDYIIHVVGPQIEEGKSPSPSDVHKLEACYSKSLDMCIRFHIRSIAFCCISTGLYGYPAAAAAEIAIYTTISWLRLNNLMEPMDIIFNVFTDTDAEHYNTLFSEMKHD